MAETSFGGGWEGAGVNRSLVGLGANSPWVWRIAAGGLFWSWQRGFVWKMSYSLSVLVQVPVLLRSQTQVMDDLRCQTLSCQGADGEGSPGAFSSASAAGLCSCCPTSPPLAVRWCPPACCARRIAAGWWLPKQAQHIKGSAQVTANGTPCASTFTMCS